MSEISKKINLSISAVSERLKKLENKDIIEKYTAVLNPKKFNKTVQVIMFVSINDTKYTENFINIVNANDDILECHYVAGDFDYALKIHTKDTDSLEVILKKIKSIDGVSKTRTSVILSSLKNLHSIKP